MPHASHRGRNLSADALEAVGNEGRLSIADQCRISGAQRGRQMAQPKSNQCRGDQYRPVGIADGQ
jgi:hypothetical protein